MAHPYNNKSPFNCWKGYERVPGTKPGAKGSCRKSSPANQNHYGESRGEGHKSGERFRSDPADRKAFAALSQVQKDSLHNQANLYGKPFFSPKHGVNVDPEDGVLSNRPVYSDNTKLTYDKIDKPFTSPMNATKGGGTTKVCLPKSKVNSMSAEEKKKVVRAKESAGRSGKRERSQRSEVKGARKKGATLKDWFEKENWVNVKTGDECGAPTKRTSYKNSETKNKSKFLKTAYDIGSTFLKGAPGVVATFLTPQTAYAHQDGQWVTNPDGSKSFEKFKFYEDDNDGGLLPKFKEEETPLNKSNEPRKTTKGKGRNFRTVEEGAGMTEKGVKEYKKKNPGSNLQTAVTEKNPKGKRAARRKSFCARSKGWTGERGRAARRRWNC